MHTNTPLTPTIDPAVNEQKEVKNEDIDKVLRGEISALESYNQVLEKVDDDLEKQRLKEFKKDHSEAVLFWKKQARTHGVKPETTSGVWGTVVEAFVGTSKLFGNKAALKAIKNGEEHGLNLYKSLLDSDNLTPTQKSQIQNKFIPMQQRHIESIRSLNKLRG